MKPALIALALWAALAVACPVHAEDTGWDWARDAALPEWVPPPLVPPDNPMRRPKVLLGRYLFYDRRLSADGTMSCGSCHHHDRGFADPRRVATGVDARPGILNPPSTANVANLPVLTWANPGERTLEQQLLIPLFGAHPLELGMSGRDGALFDALRADPIYPPLFARAFPETEGEISLAAVAKAIAAFERSITSFRSPYDRAHHGGEPDAMNPAARRGEALFFGERLECYHCHNGLTFTDNIVHSRLPVAEIGYHDTGVARSGGIGELTGDRTQRGTFRTPTLRNVALTAPYMHDGSMASLDAVLAHYARGGRLHGPNTSPLLRGFRLSAGERADVKAFLESLSDTALTVDPHWSDPWPGAAREVPK